MQNTNEIIIDLEKHLKANAVNMRAEAKQEAREKEIEIFNLRIAFVLAVLTVLAGCFIMCSVIQDGTPMTLSAIILPAIFMNYSQQKRRVQYEN